LLQVKEQPDECDLHNTMDTVLIFDTMDQVNCLLIQLLLDTSNPQPEKDIAKHMLVGNI
jgi:hypothetical protein